MMDFQDSEKRLQLFCFIFYWCGPFLYFRTRSIDLTKSIPVSEALTNRYNNNILLTLNGVLRIDLLEGPVDADTEHRFPVRQLGIEDCWSPQKTSFNSQQAGVSPKQFSTFSVMQWGEEYEIRIRIRIRRIHMFLGFPDPHPDQLVKDMYPDPNPNPSIIFLSKISKKNIDSYCFVTSLWLFIFEKWCKCILSSKSKKQKTY